MKIKTSKIHKTKLEDGKTKMCRTPSLDIRYRVQQNGGRLMLYDATHATVVTTLYKNTKLLFNSGGKYNLN